MAKKLTLDEFIEKANIKHNKYYSYYNVIYINSRTKIDITCPIHGDFKQTPNNHISGSKCPKCKTDTIKKIKMKSPTTFISEANFIHKNLYDYKKITYINTDTNITITCPTHGDFKQTPKSHLRGRGCPTCSRLNTNKKLASSNNYFIEKSNIIHNNKYIYNDNYILSKIKLKIICPIHGEFEQTPDNHLNGQGCSKCKRSKGEEVIEKILIDNNIKYTTQKRFKDCIDKRQLPFDFYLPDYNMCIEFDGEQHFKVVEYFGGEKGYEDRQRRDKIKTNYCKENNIFLLRISHNENIENKLMKLLKYEDY